MYLGGGQGNARATERASPQGMTRSAMKRKSGNEGKTPNAAGLKWYAPAEPPLQLCGFAWYESDHVYRRLPVHPHQPLPKAVVEPGVSFQKLLRTGPPQAATLRRVKSPSTPKFRSTCFLPTR